MENIETLVGARPGPEVSTPAPPTPPQPSQEPEVLEGEVVLKNNIGRKIARRFNVADPAMVGESIMKYYIMPTIAKLVCDVVANSIYMLIFKQFPGNDGIPYQYGTPMGQPWMGNAPVRNVGMPMGYQDFTQYAKPMQQQMVPPSMQRPLDYQDIIFPSMEYANKKKNEMMQEASLNQKCTVATMFKIAGQVAPYTYNSYGWYLPQIQAAEIVPYGNGWVIKLPTPNYILNN